MQNAKQIRVCYCGGTIMGPSIIEEKTLDFAVRIVNLCKFLQNEKKEYILYKQLFRCGTSIGANVAEAQQAQSRADFVSKLNIALKEAYETDYWLRLLHETNYLTESAFQSVISDCRELEKLLISIIKTAKE